MAFRLNPFKKGPDEKVTLKKEIDLRSNLDKVKTISEEEFYNLVEEIKTTAFDYVGYSIEDTIEYFAEKFMLIFKYLTLFPDLLQNPTLRLDIMESLSYISRTIYPTSKKVASDPKFGIYTLFVTVHAALLKMSREAKARQEKQHAEAVKNKPNTLEA